MSKDGMSNSLIYIDQNIKTFKNFRNLFITKYICKNIYINQF